MPSLQKPLFGFCRPSTIKSVATVSALGVGFLLSSSPANAAFTCNLVGGTLSACTPSSTLLDKTFSNFSTNYTGNAVITAETNPAATLDPAAPTFFDINFNFDPNLETKGVTYFLKYDVTINNPYLGNSYEFNGARIQQTVNGFNPDSSYTTAVTPGFAPPTVLTLLDAASPSDPAFWGSGVTSVSIFQEFTLLDTLGNDGSFDDISVNLSQRLVKSEVPGPLPVIGAAAAFGFSRKLRRRVNRIA